MGLKLEREMNWAFEEHWSSLPTPIFRLSSIQGGFQDVLAMSIPVLPIRVFIAKTPKEGAQESTSKSQVQDFQ